MLNHNIDSQTIKYKYSDINHQSMMLIMFLRAIIAKPKLFIMIDIFYFLDEEMQGKVIQLLNDLKIKTLIVRQK